MRCFRPLAFVAFTFPLLVGACGALEDFDNTRDAVSQKSDAAGQTINDGRSGPTVITGQVYMHQHQFAGGTALLNIHGNSLPPNTPAFKLNSEGAELTLRDIATEVTAQTHIPVDLDDSPPSLQGKGGGQPAASTSAASCRLAVNTGKEDLPHFLDALATWCDMSWSFKGGRFKWQQYETVAYSFFAEPTIDTLKTAMTSTGTAPTSNSSGGGGQSTSTGATAASGQSLNQSAETSADLNAWSQIKDVLTSFANPGRVEIAPAHRTVVVVAKHSAQVQIKKLIDELNRRHMRQITFTVQIMDINSTNNIDLGTSLIALYNNLQGQYALAGSTPASLAAQAAGAGAVSLTVQNNTLTGKTNKLATSSAALNALQNVGQVSGDNTVLANTLDGKPTSVTIARQVTYFSSSMASQSTATTLSTVQEATLTVGLTMQLLPTVLDDGEIILQYNFGLSSLNSLNPTSQNGTILDAPDINVQSSVQHALVASGDSLLLLGYEQKALNQTDQGIPGTLGSLFGFIGGSKSLQNSHTALAIIITPQLRQNGVSGQ